MQNYCRDLLAQRGKRSDLMLTSELEEALNEALAKERTLSTSELLAWHVCSVAHCDGLEAVLETQPESVPIAAKFAREKGLLETADALDKVVNGIGADDPVSMTMQMHGKTVPEELPAIKWGAADIFLSMVDEDLDVEILDFVAEFIDEFIVPAPESVLKAAAKRQKIAKRATKKTATQLLKELIAHQHPRLRCALNLADGGSAKTQTIDVVVSHSANGSLSSGQRAALERKYGTAAAPLFDMLALHDGAALFVADGEAAFHLLPSCVWPEHMEGVMDWAQQVTWADELDEIPAYLKSAIPFGYTPGDSERWLFIVEGDHAGKIMLSESDVIEDEPRFESLAEFMSALIVDAKRILGCGGYICYDKAGHNAGGGDGCYYPEKYLFDH